MSDDTFDLILKVIVLAASMTALIFGVTITVSLMETLGCA